MNKPLTILLRAAILLTCFMSVYALNTLVPCIVLVAWNDFKVYT